MHLDGHPNPEALLQHADFLRGLARGLLAGADADDVEQETWLRALEKGPRHDANLKGWLATVARNSARIMWRGEKRRGRREEVVARPEGVPSAAEVASRVEIQSLLADAVKSLEEPYRTTVVLAFYDGLSPTEIAAQQGIPVDTVRTRIRRALQRLRAALDQNPGGRQAWVAALTPLLWPKAAAAAVTGALAMSLRMKVALVILILVPTVWLGREAWRGHVDVDRVRSADSGRDAVERTEDGRFEAPKADAAGNPLPPIEAKVGFVGRVVANGLPVRGAWVAVHGEGAEDVEQRGTGDDGMVRTGHVRDVVVRAWHPAYGPGELRVAEVAKGRVLDIELSGGIDVPVEVLDARTGAGIAGAEIHVMSAGRAGGIQGINAGLEDTLGSKENLPRLLSAISIEDLLMQGRNGNAPAFRMAPVRTDETGRATLRGMPEGTFEAIVLHEDFLTRRVRKAPVRERAVRIRVNVGATLDVLASVVRGQPGSGMVCEVKRGGIMPMPVAFTRLDERGRARFEHLPTGEFAVVVSSGGTDSFILGLGAAAVIEPKDGEPNDGEEKEEPVKAVSRVVSLREGETAEVRFADRSGTRLFGRVMQAGTALPDRAIWLHLGERKIAEVRTDAEGRYSFDQLEPGTYQLRADVDDSLLVEETVVIEGDAREIEVDLAPARGALGGRVVGPDGKPAAGCEVVLTRAFDGPDPELERGGEAAILYALRGRAETDDNGRFRIEGVAPGAYRVLFGHERRLAARRIEVAEGDALEIDVDLGRERTHALRVRFEDPDGEPIAAALLIRGAHNEFAEAYALGVELEARTEYGFQLPVGRYRLAATADGFAAIHGEIVELGADREVTLRFAKGIDFELAVRRDGRPVAGARVELIQENGVALGPARSLLSLVQAPRAFETSDDGDLTIPGVAPGRYRVRVDGRERGWLTVSEETTRRTIDLAQAK